MSVITFKHLFTFTFKHLFEYFCDFDPFLESLNKIEKKLSQVYQLLLEKNAS